MLKPGDGQLREAARTVVWLAGGGAGSRDSDSISASGSTWHSCEKVTRETERVERVQELWTKSEQLINMALNFKK